MLLGNEPPEILYKNIGSFNGQAIALRVTNQTVYDPPGPKQTGIKGAFGNINQGPGETVQFLFEFVNDDGAPYDGNYTPSEMIPLFHFSFFDLDGHDSEFELEELQVLTEIDSFELTEPTEIEFLPQNTPQNPSDFPIWKSTQPTLAADNPSDPLNLTDKQKRKSVIFQFSNKNSFEIVFTVGPQDPNWPADVPDNARNFLFAGVANITITDFDNSTAEATPPPPSPPAFCAGMTSIVSSTSIV